MEARVEGDTRVGRRKSGDGVLLSLGGSLAVGASGNGNVFGVDVLGLRAPWVVEQGLLRVMEELVVVV